MNVRSSLACRRNYRLCVAVASLFAAGISQAEFPDRVIKVVTGHAAGSVPDTLARTFADRMTTAMKQTVVVENVEGLNAVLGAAQVARRPADGYTVFICPMSTMTISGQIIGSNLPIDPGLELAPIAMVMMSSYAVVVGTDSPYRSLNDIIAAAKSKPGQITFASPGIGSAQHLGGEFLKRDGKVEMVHIPYKSSPGFLFDVIAGRVDFALTTIPQAATFVKSGKLRAIAQADSTKSNELPNLPRISDTFPGFEIAGWFGICARKSVPSGVKTIWSEKIKEAMSDPEFTKKMVNAGLNEPFYEDTVAAVRRFDADRERWKKVIDGNNISVK